MTLTGGKDEAEGLRIFIKKLTWVNFFILIANRLNQS
jgi:hypothetical protein